MYKVRSFLKTLRCKNYYDGTIQNDEGSSDSNFRSKTETQAKDRGRGNEQALRQVDLEGSSTGIRSDLVKYFD